MPETRGHLLSYQCNDSAASMLPRESHAVSIVTSRYGDGKTLDFGLFIVTRSQHTSDEPTTPEKNGAAAALAAQVVVAEMLQHYYHKVQLGNMDVSPPDETLVESIKSSNKTIRNKMKDTAVALTAAVVVDGQLTLAHLGNCRAYLMDGSNFRQITTDYPLAQPDSKEAPVRVIGQSDGPLEIDLIQQPFAIQTNVFLSSHAIWQPDEIESAIRLTPTPARACNRLMSVAEERHEISPATILMRMVEATG
ncbi:MAG: hypothetical protein GYB66_06875 [Chloroflexi bacterium]|nr:hypothetical protein [Chloroflexota bacterium]